jgi:hypothetical protein
VKRLTLLAVALVVLFAAAAAVVPLGPSAAEGGTVVLMGDSLLAQASADITTGLAKLGFSVDSSAAYPGAGLLDTQINWLAKARRLKAEDHPTIAVVEYVGNYGIYGGISGVRVYTRPFYRRWEAAAQRLEDVLSSGGTTVYWVIGPPVAPRVPERGIEVLDRIYENLHAPRTQSGRPPLIDVTPALTGGTGRYTGSLSEPDGKRIQVRRSDGVHLTAAGQALFAQAVIEAIG